MGFIGKQPTPVPLTSSDITDGIISTAKIADDAVENTKLDLSANYAFTGTVSGVGKLLQAVPATSVAGDVSSTTQASWRSGGLSVQITPSATTSKILLLLMVCPESESGSNTAVSIHKNITSSTAVNTVITGGTNLGGSDYGLAQWFDSNGNSIVPVTLSILDSPSSTSQQTYTYSIRTYSGNTNSPMKGGSNSQFIALEVGA